MRLHFRREHLRLAHTWTIARGSAEVLPVVVVELSDADGIVGRGEAAPVSRYLESPDSVEGFLRQIDPRRLSFRDLDGSLTYLDSLPAGNAAARCSLDVALHDGAAKHAGLPLHDFLQLGFREGHHITSFSIGIDSPENIRTKVQQAQSYPVLKLKVGVPGEREILAALREMAPHKPVRVDANEGWRTKEEALERLEWLAGDGHIQFVEQPLPQHAPPADLVWLKERSPLPLFADESFHSAASVEHCARCFHGVNAKLVKTGGIRAAVTALKVARAAGLKTMLGCMIETSVLISAAAHLAELCDYLDLDGNLLINYDPYRGVSAWQGRLSFARAPDKFGLQVEPIAEIGESTTAQATP